MNTVLRLALNDLKRDWKRPWTIILLAVLPLLMATLLALIFGPHSGSSKMPAIQVAVLDLDKDMLSGMLRSMSGQGDAGKNLRLHFVDTREEGIQMLEKRQASAFVVLPPHMTESLLQGKTNILELYENPAEQILPKVVREGALLGASVLSGGAEVLREPLTQMRELFRQSGFPTEAAVADVATDSVSRLRHLRGYLFPPLLKFETVEAEKYQILND